MSRSIIVRDNKEIAEGSLSAIAKAEGKSLAESFANADVAIMLDVSGSMGKCDAPTEMGMVSRHDSAEIQVRRLQEKYQGKVALFCFSDTVLFVPDGIPVRLNGLTEMNRALRFLKRADGMGIKLILLSDGAPTDGEEAVLKTAREFTSRIDCIYIGPDGADHYYDGGKEFLARVAETSGGRFVVTEEVADFYEDAEIFLLTG